jgi:hypothetical protein
MFNTEKTQGPPPMQADQIGGFGTQAKNPSLVNEADWNSFEHGYRRGCEDSKDILDELFSYHAPTAEDIPKYTAINEAARNFARIVRANCVAGVDFYRAIELIRMARMTANASIALKGRSL